MNWGFQIDSPVACTCPRGTKGPRSKSSDFKSTIMEGFGFAAGAMMQMTMQSQHSHFCSESSSSSVSHQVSHSPSPVIRSSSPPAPEEKLDVCVDQFPATLKQKMPAEQLQNTKLALKAEDYNVNLLGQGSSVIIAQVTGLKPGPAGGLKRFAKSYSAVLECKCSRWKYRVLYTTQESSTINTGYIHL
ncbi:hypothetical protein GYMLUDRAFT_59721 [Collybiopsis luxurians FD-317 M1]|uniref:Uncharacterized protein n=1 Tax=Collybiopsis luxurians FD-317 M1 TaxID=944289 RepID=A0A0D0BWH2_9AGAR|nr:hypothetical protein GYMLUDRAFT_59721 [Collybiopsis luxurians FD-317 M1]